MEQDEPQKLSQLTANRPAHRQQSAAYSKFIRMMRVVLPFTALSIIAVVMSWNTLRKDQVVAVQQDPQDQAIGKNELLNPRFESRDEKSQPYTITATRAVQGTADDDLLLLEAPMADIMLNSGHWLALKAQNGEFRQASQLLFLRKDVSLFHDDGYTMNTQKIDIDLNKKTAITDVAVSAHGPAGTLNAAGMNADGMANKLVFTGPAKLVLVNIGNDMMKGFSP